jgi:hypothetical protein
MQTTKGVPFTAARMHTNSQAEQKHKILFIFFSIMKQLVST